MKENQKKVLGEKRRELILSWLQSEASPLTGSELAKRTNVSRQIIVQDISLLKARNEPIIATSQGYVYMQKQHERPAFQRLIVCHHKPEQTAEELYLLVDRGILVKDVIVEHPVYGELTASIMVSTRKEVEELLTKLQETKASFLSQLTEGIHLHTIEADSPAKLDDACQALEEAGFLVES